MKKFKIKNRRKRKYVKKSDLSQSFSQTQTLTLGLVPLVLMAIAFFTTAIMYSPTLATIQIPTIRLSAPVLPEISFPKMSLPTDVALPKVSVPTLPEVRFTQPELPKVTMPELPKATLPNPIPYVVSFGNSIVKVFNQGIQAILTGIEVIDMQLTSFIVRAAVVLDPRPALSAILHGVNFVARQFAVGIQITFTTIGQGIAKITTFFVQLAVTIFTWIATTISQTIAWISQTLTAFGKGIQQLTIQSIATISSWTQSALVATVNGWKAFVWIIGTPFRAIGKAADEFKIFMAPYVAYLGEALNRASDDLEAGGKALSQGSMYVSETIEHNSEK